MPNVYYKRKFLVSIALYLKTFISRIKICISKEAVGITDNRSKFNNNLKD